MIKISTISIILASSLVLISSIIFTFSQTNINSNYNTQKSLTQNINSNRKPATIIQDEYFKIDSIRLWAANFNGLIYGESGNPLDPQPDYEPETDINIELNVTALKDKRVEDLNLTDLTINSDSKSVPASTNNYRVEGTNLIIFATVPPNNFEINDNIYATFKLSSEGYTSQEIKTPTTLVDVSI